MENKPNWYENVHRIGIIHLDLGPEFGRLRHEYHVLFYNADGNSEQQPGKFSAKTGKDGYLEHIRELAEIIRTRTGRECSIDLTPVKINKMSKRQAEELEWIRANELRNKWVEQNCRTANDNNAPGGSYDHKNR